MTNYLLLNGLVEAQHMNSFVKFWHELINPHCPHCIAERKELLEQREMDREISLICNSCEAYKMQLSIVNQQNEKLINKLTKPEKEVIANVMGEAPKPLQTRQVPWSVKRQQLESESKLRAAELRQKINAENNAAKPDIEKLENELGIGNGTTTST